MKLRIARKSAGISKIDWQNQNFSEAQNEIMKSKFKELEANTNLYIIKPEKSDL
jgi:hypothetical protein